MQTTRGAPSSGAVAPDGKLLSATEPPAVPPALFVAPSGQVIAPSATPPSSRQDVVQLQHQLDQKIATALGVPPIMVSDGSRFAASSSAQMRAFNAMTADIATFVSTVLTQTYVSIYGGTDDDRLVVRALNVQSFEELVQVHTAKLVPTEHLAPMIMATIGFSKDEQQAALKTLMAQTNADADASPPEEAVEAEGTPPNSPAAETGNDSS